MSRTDSAIRVIAAPPAAVCDVVEVRFLEVEDPVGISAEDHAAGLASTLANLDDFVSR